MTVTAKLIRATAIAAVMAAAGCKSAPAMPPPLPSRRRPPTWPRPFALFNGKDTSGWVQVLDSKWLVEDGVLLARQDPAGRRGGESWLFTDKDFADFVLR